MCAEILLRSGNSSAQTLGRASASYFSLFVLLIWQALRAQPLTSPDSVTLVAFGTLAIATTATAWFSTRRPRSVRVPAVVY